MKNLKINKLDLNGLTPTTKQVIFDLVYPVGSYIYIDNPGFDTVAKVEAYYGGHWKQVADGTFIEAGSTPGTHEPGLPNIGGNSMANARDGQGSAGGAFLVTDSGSAQLSNATNIKGKVTFSFNAASGENYNGVYHNNVYGKSDTVQPKSKVVYIYHRLPVQNS